MEKVARRHGAAEACIIKQGLLLSASALVLLATAPSHAAEPAQAAATQGPVEEVIVTGTRIVRDGYEAPTPVSVLGAPELEATAVTNVAEAVNRLPAFFGSTITNGNGASYGGNTSGANSLNLRGLQPIRTLVLLDGKRIVGSNFSGFNNDASAVDINTIPNNLIARVDVVTGGASAVYGSDALAGVVNFVLDKKFTGVKGSVEGNVTTYGDDEGYSMSLAVGEPFANDRGHVLVSGEHVFGAGIRGNDRPWNDISYSLMPNPGYAAGNGQPQFITVSDRGSAQSTPGGLIVSGPLKGTMFGPGGAPGTFTFGSRVSGALMSGGDYQISRFDNLDSLDLRLQRTNVFTRLSYDITDDITAYAEVSWSRSKGRSLYGVAFFHLGNVTVLSGNPFIPASVQARMTALGLTSFTLGTTNADESTGFSPYNARTQRRWMGGFEGKLTAFDTTWNWSAYAQRSMTGVSARVPHDEIGANYTLAVDAVLSPTTGQIVCRSTLTDPTNGCVPYNVMGIGVNTQAALRYIQGTAFTYVNLTQDVQEASITGEPLSTWAGPVSIALDFAHRKESTRAISTPLDQAAGYFSGNFSASIGQYTVTEGAAEAVIPLAKDVSWARSLDLNAAARATDYSTSGYVTTWKVGGTYKPIDDITFRATQSRDIRAPNLSDLFNAGNSGGTTVNDNGSSVFIRQSTTGNPNLQPEKADSTGLGAVLQPSFLPGFGASVDYFNIKINGAITSLNAQNIVNLCNAGNTSFCGNIQRNGAGQITVVNVKPANFQVQSERGIDFEASYSVPLDNIVADWGGKLSFRGLATYVDSLKTIGNGQVVEGAGVTGGFGGIGTSGLSAPRWKYVLSATYENDTLSGTLTKRGVGSGVYNNALIQCTSGCPTATAANPTVDNNHVPAWSVYDLSLTYKVFESTQVFLTVQNLFNTDPPLIAAPASSGVYTGQNNAQFDQFGRVFRAGVRFKM
jgi:outer membrane receptor protein involved in Fe transport